MVFQPLPQGPMGIPEQPRPDPPGYYMGWPAAGLAKRCTSGMIDYGIWPFVVLLLPGFLGLGVQAAAGQKPGETVAVVSFVALLGVTFYNDAILPSRTGQSLGKRVMGLRLVRTVDLEPANFIALVIRSVVIVFIDIFCFGIGLLAIGMSTRRQCIGDRIAGTVVLDERQAGMTINWAVGGPPAQQTGPPQPREVWHPRTTRCTGYARRSSAPRSRPSPHRRRRCRRCPKPSL